MKSYLSIDVGTSSTKLALFDDRGRLLVSYSAPYAVEYPRPEWAEQDPELWWQAVCALGPQVMQHPQAAHIAGIALSGQTPLCAPVDEAGRPLRKAILWLDRRATPQVDWLREHIGEERCRAVSRNRVDSYFGGLKWLWFRQNEPEAFARTWKILQASSFVTLRLTGQVVIDPAQAGLCSPCFNFARADWDPAICAEMGIPLEMLPAVRPAWEVVGAVSAAAARATGLPEGAPVVCGGGDFACAALGTGITGAGEAALMLGTAGNLLFPGAASDDPRLLHTIHLTGDPLPFGGVLAGGNLNWFADLFGGPAPRLFERLNEQAARVPAGSEGLVYLPYIMGERTPIWDPAARGAFVGLSARHTRAHLYRAILEGIAFAFRQVKEIALGQAGSLTAITAIDGGARSPLWRAILASALGVPVREGGDQAGTALGSAFLAALGTGGATNFDGIRAWTAAHSTTPPDPAATRVYDRLYPVFAGLYAKLKDDFDVLGEDLTP